MPSDHSHAHDNPQHASTIRQHPVTRAGRWAGRLLIVGATTFMLASALTGAFGRRGPGTLDDVMQITGPIIGIVLVGSGIGALVLSILAMFFGKERSWVLWLSLVFGLFGATFLLGEILLPH